MLLGRESAVAGYVEGAGTWSICVQSIQAQKGQNGVSCSSSQGCYHRKKSLPVNSYVVVLFDGAFQILSVLDDFTIDSKIIYDKAKHDWSPHVAIQAWSELCLVVPTLEQPFLEQPVGKDAGLRESVHPTFYADVHPTVVFDGA